MKVLVTGKSGQLAQALAERNRHRFDLILAGRPELDLETPGSAQAVIAAARPNAVINAAAYTAVDQAEDEAGRAVRINGEAAGEVAAAAADLGIPVIQMSTDYVFDGAGRGPYDEDAATAPLGVYGQSKLAGEDAVRHANPRHVIIRTAWIYSPFAQNFVKAIMTAAKVREVLAVVDDQCGTPTSALDLADGLLAMLDHWHREPGLGVGQTYHLAGTGSTSWFGFASAIMAKCERLGLPIARVTPIASADWPTKAKRPQNSRLSSEKFARAFGFAMPPWQTSVERVVERLAQKRPEKFSKSV